MILQHVVVQGVEQDERRPLPNDLSPGSPIGVRNGLGDDLVSMQQTKGVEMNAPSGDDGFANIRPIDGRTLANAQANTASKPLTTAQFRVAELVAQGMTNPEIATALGLSRYTVESHLAASYRRIGIRSRVDLAILFSRDADRWRPHS
jgi:DNA-binding CsgD family transcriptional regulator